MQDAAARSDAYYAAYREWFVDSYDAVIKTAATVGTGSAIAFFAAGTIAVGAWPVVLGTLTAGAVAGFVYDGAVRDAVRSGPGSWFDANAQRPSAPLDVPPQGAIRSFDIDGLPGQVYRLYEAVFDRDPDLAGLGHWIRGVEAQPGSIRWVASNFLASGEFAQRYGASSSVGDEQFLALLYRNVLNRDSDPSGLDFWAGRVQAGASREDSMIAFAESAENKANLRAEVQDGIWYL